MTDTTNGAQNDEPREETRSHRKPSFCQVLFQAWMKPKCQTLR